MAASALPKLREREGNKELIVDGAPFVVLGGEMHNSTSSDPAATAAVMDKARSLNMNTVIAPVTWELVEPQEGVFDFTMVDDLIRLARERGLRLGLLWFGAWKNGQCTYAPEWVKCDLDRFRRAEQAPGVRKWYLDFFGMTLPYSTLSALCAETRDADARAFAQVMAHVREVDGDERTVIFVQVENECGIMGTAREHSVEADAAFAQEVPAELVSFMRDHKEALAPRFADALAAGSGAGSWEEVFGTEADELFQTWHTARYVEAVASAGKEEYPLPMMVNCWLDKGDEAGSFPTGGPVGRAMEVWAVAAPTIEAVAPDIYVPNFCDVCDEYRKLGNPLAIVETATHAHLAPRALWAVGHHHSPIFAPFGYEDLGQPFDDTAGILFGASLDSAAATPQDAAEYAEVLRLLGQVAGLAVERDGSLDALQAVISERSDEDLISLATTGIKVTYADDSVGACAALPLGPDEAVVIALNCGLGFVATDPACAHVDYLAVEEGDLVRGEDGALGWRRTCRLNGDEATDIKVGAPTLLRIRLLSFA